jgi:hypothetical protein
MSIADRIRELRGKSGRTDRELADMLGLGKADRLLAAEYVHEEHDAISSIVCDEYSF